MRVAVKGYKPDHEDLLFRGVRRLGFGGHMPRLGPRVKFRGSREGS